MGKIKVEIRCEHDRWKNNCRICFPRLVCVHGSLKNTCRRCCSPDKSLRLSARDRKARHSFTVEDEARFLDALAGNRPCDFCGLSFVEGEMPYVDHDHSCCPTANHCHQCLRGFVHGLCNTHAISWMEEYERKTGVVIDILKRYQEKFRRN